MRQQETGGSPKPRVVRCPRCGGDSLYAPTNPYRPFCSERCKGLDLGAWASESFRLESDAPADDQPFGDPRVQ
jgi:uncharacterized protein